jgi:hypothetical protein
MRFRFSNRTRSLGVLRALAIATSLALSASVARADCEVPPHENLDSGDQLYMDFWRCQQTYIDFFWNNYDFDEEDWDQGFGYHDPCNLDLPMARTFNALIALHYSAADYATDPDDRNGSILRWGGSFSQTNIDELNARCASSTGAAAGTENDFGPDNYTDLYLPFFYGFNVVERAGSILHEARHASGVDHSSCSCPRGRSCDSNWALNGANRYESVWLWDFSQFAVNTTFTLKQRARDFGNNLLRTSFCQDPGFFIPEVWDAAVLFTAL